MKLSVRTDLGGYAVAGRPAFADVEVTKPFVFLCGPNGSGKTATLRMLRASIGLAGEREGAPLSAFGRHRLTPPEANGDLGRLAAFGKPYGRGEPDLDRDIAGVLDVRALGWRGERTWLFDSRVETARSKASSFESDLVDHVEAMMASRSASHGEGLRRAWNKALYWALGLLEVPDPYDDPNGLPDSLAGLRDALVKERPRERWLLLDEPETALDAEAFATGVVLLATHAAPGSLRVFCASHSPVFAAGLADHPNVQVVDLGQPKPWLDAQRALLRLAGDPAKIAAIGERVVADMRTNDKLGREAAARERLERAAVVAGQLSRESRKLLAACLASGGTAKVGSHRGANNANFEAGRDKAVLSPSEDGKEVSLTDFGREVASRLPAPRKARSKAKGPDAVDGPTSPRP